MPASICRSKISLMRLGVGHCSFEHALKNSAIVQILRRFLELFAIVDVGVFPYTWGTCNEGRRLGCPWCALTSTG